MFSKSLIAIIMLSAVSASQASEGFYVGINAGQASYDVTLNDFAVLDDGSITSAKLMENSISYNLALGYQLTPYFSLEGGYIDLGDISVNATSDGAGALYARGPVSLEAETDGLFIDIKGQFPIYKEIHLSGRLGYLDWDSEVTLSDSTRSVSASTDDKDTFYGVGVSIKTDDVVTFNIDYTFYKLDDLDVDVLSAGLQFGF